MLEWRYGWNIIHIIKINHTLKNNIWRLFCLALTKLLLLLELKQYHRVSSVAWNMVYRKDVWIFAGKRQTPEPYRLFPVVANVKNISLLLTFVRIKVCLKYYPNDHNKVIVTNCKASADYIWNHFIHRRMQEKGTNLCEGPRSK